MCFYSMWKFAYQTKCMNIKILLYVILPFQFIACQSNNEMEDNHDQDNTNDVEQLVSVSDNSDLTGLPSNTPSTNYVKEQSLKGDNPSPYGYIIRRPEGFGNDDLQYPILIFLHGVGSRGNSATNPNDLNKVDQGAAIRAVKLGLWSPSVAVPVVVPQTNTTWKPTEVKKFIQYLIDTYSNAINKDRIYIGGFSMGGAGVWSYLNHFGYDDGLVAAAVSLAGASDITVDVESLKLMPFWAFHGQKDPTVSVTRTTNIVTAFRTKYPSQQHQKLTLFTQDDFDGKYHRIDHGVFDRTFWEKNHTGDVFETDVMNWMLQYKR